MKISADELQQQRFEIPLSNGRSVAAALLQRGQHAAQAPGNSDLLLLAHGAGQDMDSDFMQAIATHLATSGSSVLRFNFPYMEIARDSGRRRPPDRAPRLEQCWREVADYARARFKPQRLILGGKSMGGRMATRIAAAGYRCDGLLLLGYPLHPPGKADKLRSEQLPLIDCPMLFIQGDRDRLCQLDLLKPVLATLSPTPTLHVIDGGDHSLQLLKRLQRSQDSVFSEVSRAYSHWAAGLHAEQ